MHDVYTAKIYRCRTVFSLLIVRTFIRFYTVIRLYRIRSQHT